MAFSKMEGFDVTPRSPSSSINLWSSPEDNMPRRMKSNQTLWPKVPNSNKGLPVMFLLLGFHVIARKALRSRERDRTGLSRVPLFCLCL
jgi:hypothetical protein